jgi:hypothetical protein
MPDERLISTASSKSTIIILKMRAPVIVYQYDLFVKLEYTPDRVSLHISNAPTGDFRMFA